MSSVVYNNGELRRGMNERKVFSSYTHNATMTRAIVYLDL